MGCQNRWFAAWCARSSLRNIYGASDKVIGMALRIFWWWLSPARPRPAAITSAPRSKILDHQVQGFEPNSGGNGAKHREAVDG